MMTHLLLFSRFVYYGAVERYYSEESMEQKLLFKEVENPKVREYILSISIGILISILMPLIEVLYLLQPFPTSASNKIVDYFSILFGIFCSYKVYREII